MMCRIRLLPLLLLSWIIFPLSGSTQELRIRFNHLAVEDGLSDGTVPYVYLDTRGYVWLGTLNGVNRYDGREVEVFKSDPNDLYAVKSDIPISTFFEDPEKNIWFSASHYLQVYQWASDRFRSFSLCSDRYGVETEPHRLFHLEEDGHLWVRVGSQYDSEIHRYNPHSGQDTTLAVTAGHRQYVVTGPSGKVEQVLSTMRFKEKGLELIDLRGDSATGKVYFQKAGKDGLPVLITHNAYVEHASLIWLGSDKGLVRFDPKTGKAEIADSYDGRKIGDAWSVIPFAENYLFVSTSREGVLLFDKYERRFVQQFIPNEKDPESLRFSQPKELYLDRQQNLWISSWENGCDFGSVYNSQFQVFLDGKKEGEPRADVLSIAETRSGRVVVGTDRQGLFLFDQQKERIAHWQPKSISRDYRPAFDHIGLDREGRILALADYDIFVYKEGKDGLFPVDTVASDHHLNQFCQLASGRAIVGTAEGILELREEGTEGLRLVPLRMENSAAPSSVSAIYQDSSGYIFLVVENDLVWVCEETASGLRLVKPLSGFGYSQSFFSMEDRVLAATLSGLSEICRDELTFRTLSVQEDGCPGDSFYGILPDEKGNLWLSSSKGLVRYHPVDKIFYRHTTADGLPTNKFNRRAWWKDSRGEMWFGSTSGLVVFDPAKIKLSDFRPGVELTEVRINDEARDSLLIIAKRRQRLSLPYAGNTVAFDFRALEFSEREENQYQYRMLGLEEGWVYSGNRGTARYANLAPGNYTFQVKTTNTDGIWTEEPYEISINIKTPWFMTWWFWILAGVTLVALFVGLPFFLYQERLKNQLAMERMRVRISSDLHDDVGGDLTGLAMQAEILAESPEMADPETLRWIHERSRAAMYTMRDIVWSIDAKKDKVANLVDRIREYANETLTPREIGYHLEVDQEFLQEKLPSPIRHNLYLIAKEALANIAKHSNGDRVRIHLGKKADGYDLLIRDNGDVPPGAHPPTGQGLGNMKARAEAISAGFRISRDEGFEVSVHLRSLNMKEQKKSILAHMRMW